MKLVTKIFKRNDWYVTSAFGKRVPIQTSNGTSSDFHNGCDYGTNCEKWPQYAIEDGEVIDCGTADDGANYVWINYPRINKKLLHYHLDSIKVETGQKVTEQTIIGYTGKTGMATGIHLHLGMQESNGNIYQDPDAYNYIPQNSDDKIVQYIVQKGDNLTKIAEKYNTTWQNIYEENKALIGNNPNIIKQGQILKITNSKVLPTKYVVQKGDNLTKIAEKYNTTWQNIYEKNKNIIGSNPDIIKPGQIIEI